MAKFWRLQAPSYSDYRHTFVNGTAEYAYSLPGIRCDACGATWIQPKRVVPFCLPPDCGVSSLPAARPVSLSVFRETCEMLRRALLSTRSDVANYQFQPGQVFLPAWLDVPSRPEADFLWGGWCPVVSARVKEALEARAITGAAFFPAAFRRVGDRSAGLLPPDLSSGEPEDVMRRARHAKVPGSPAQAYFHMVLTGESKWPEYLPARSNCGQCGRRSWEPPGDPMNPEWWMTEGMWDGTDVFHLCPTTMCVVTDTVRGLLEALKPTNVAYALL